MKMRLQAKALVVLGFLLVSASQVRVSYANEEEYEGDYEEGGPEMEEYDGEGEYGDFGDLGDMGMGMDGMGGYGEDEISPGDHIPGFIELDDMTFEKFVPGPRPALVEFYADWCGHCKTLAKELDMIGTVFGEHRRLDLVKVNADVNSQLAQKFGIEGFPTLKFFHTDGTIEEVEAREMDELADFLWDKVGKVSFVPQLKPHLERFMHKSNDRSQVLRETEEAVAELTDSKVRGFGELYLKIMRGIIKKGDDYLEKEKARMNTMIEKDVSALSEEKIREFAAKIEIIEIFSNDINKDEL